MIINHNISSIKMANHMRVVNLNMKKNMEKLSSGYEINRAADNPSGLAVSEKLRTQIEGIDRASKNAVDGMNFLQTAEGSMMNIEKMLNRMRSLAVLASNGVYTHEDRMQVQYEVDSLINEIDRVSKDTEFNTLKLLRGAFRKEPENINYSRAIDEKRPYDPKSADPGIRPLTNPDPVKDPLANPVINGGRQVQAVAPAPAAAPGEGAAAAPAAAAPVAGNSNTSGGTYIHIGPNMDQRIKVYIENMSAFNLGIAQEIAPDNTVKSSLDYSSVEGANAAIGRLDTALYIVSRERANIGAYQNRIEHAVDYLQNTSISLKSAESQIRDTNIAEKMSDFVRDKILLETSSTMLSHSNMSSQVVLKLLNI